MIEIGFTNGPLLGFELNYADSEYPYNEFSIYLFIIGITFSWY